MDRDTAEVILAVAMAITMVVAPVAIVVIAVWGGGG